MLWKITVLWSCYNYNNCHQCQNFYATIFDTRFECHQKCLSDMTKIKEIGQKWFFDKLFLLLFWRNFFQYENAIKQCHHVENSCRQKNSVESNWSERFEWKKKNNEKKSKFSTETKKNVLLEQNSSDCHSERYAHRIYQSYDTDANGSFIFVRNIGHVTENAHHHCEIRSWNRKEKK